MIHFLATAEQAFTIRDFLASRGQSLADRLRFVEYASLATQETFERGAYVLADLDRLSPAMMHFLREWHERLSRENGFRFLNHPTRTLRRYQLLETLHRDGENDFRAIRATGDLTRLRYPVFLRSERDHDGNASPLLHSTHEVEVAIARALLRGYRLGDLLLVEFCSTVDAHGFYRKYGAFIIGDRIVPRNMGMSRDWMIKSRGTEATRAWVCEDRDYVLTNPHRARLAEIFRKAGVEYGRIDYAVKDGRIQTWEVNVAPTIGEGRGRSSVHLSEELQRLRAESREFFFRELVSAWEAADVTADGALPVTIAMDVNVRRAALDTRRRVTRLGGLRERLRILDPWIKPVVMGVLPVMGFIARRLKRR